MKKCFLNNTLKNQKISKELALMVGLKEEDFDRESFGTFNKFIVLTTIETEKSSLQVVIQNVANNANNSYLIVCVDKGSDDVFGAVYVPSFLVIPPVWNREFGGIDYSDFLKIQIKANSVLEKHRGESLKLNFALKGKSIFFPRGKIEEVKALFDKGEDYGDIVAIFAEKAPKDMIDHCLVLNGFNPEEVRKNEAL